MKANISEDAFNDIGYFCRYQGIQIYSYGDDFYARKYCGQAYFFHLYHLYENTISISHCSEAGPFLQLELYCYHGYHIQLPLCDVAVLGKPDVNINCSNCLQNPESLPCGNGLWCEHCKPGWLPPDCQQPCEIGYYGINCLYKCQHHCTNVPCDNVSGVITDPKLCIICDMWYINPQSLCRDYIEKLEPYKNAIIEVDVNLKNITMYISYDNRISKKVSNYYKYYIEYSLDNFSSYKTVTSYSHIQTGDNFTVSFINDHTYNVELWVRVRLFREQSGVKETGTDPASVLIPKICFPSFKSDTCQTLMVSCSENCVDKYSNEEMSVLYKLSEDTSWVSVPVHPHMCPINLPLHDGGMYKTKLRLISYENGVLVKVVSDLMTVDVVKCMESTSGTSNKHTLIIVVVFSGMFKIYARQNSPTMFKGIAQANSMRM